MEVNNITYYNEKQVNFPKRAAELGKEDFLKVLLTQLKYQTPFEPLKDVEFIAQLAQFNALEQMINLNRTFEAMLKFTRITQASALIGKTVTTRNTEGKVTQVLIEGDKVKLVVNNALIDLDSVLKIA